MMWLFFKRKIKIILIVMGTTLIAGWGLSVWVNRTLQRIESSIPGVISKQINLPVEIKKTQLYWSGWDITLILQDVSVIDPDVHLPFLSAQRLEMSLSILDWLKSRQITLNHLSLTRANLVLDSNNGLEKLEVMGLAGEKLPQNIDIKTLQARLMQLSTITLDNLHITWLTPLGKINQVWSGKWSWRSKGDYTWGFQGDQTLTLQNNEASLSNSVRLKATGLGEQLTLSLGDPLSIDLESETVSGKWQWRLTGKDIDVAYLKKVLPKLTTWKRLPAWALWVMNSVEQGSIQRLSWEQGDDLTGKVEFKDMDLNYNPGWPRLASLTGSLLYEQGRWEAKADKATLVGVPVNALTSRGYVDHTLYHVTVDGALTTKLETGKAFLKSSPLNSTIGPLLKEYDVRGDMDLSLKLDIPINLSGTSSESSEPVTVQGAILMRDATIINSHIPLRISNIHGALNFTEHNLRADFEKTTTVFPKPFNAYWPSQGDWHVKAAWNRDAKTFSWEGHFANAWDAKLKWLDDKFYHGHVIFNPGKQEVAEWPRDQDKTLLLTSTQFQARVNGWDVVNDNAKSPIILRCSFLKLPDLAEAGELSKTKSGGWNTGYVSDTARAVHFFSESTWLGRRFLGKVTLKASPQKTGWLVNEFSIRNNNLSLTGHGKWNIEKASTQLTGEISSQNVGALLGDWKYSADLKEGQLAGKFDIHWPGDPSQLTWATLSGDVSLNINNGRLVSVEPGFGRFMGLLSIENLKRRLKLDFSDLFKKGFLFDECRSNLRFMSGKIEIKQAHVVAPSADLDITGFTDIRSEAWSLYVKAVPKSTTTFPLAAAIAIGNPAVGAGVWMFDKITGSRLSKVSALNYHVTGTWKDPKIKKVPSLGKIETEPQ